MNSRLSARLLRLDEIYDQAGDLALRLMDAGLSFDIVVAIARGGLPPGRFMCDLLNVSRLSTVQISHYAGPAQKMEKARIVSKLGTDIAGCKVLLIDDVNDTGKTLQAAQNYLDSLNPAQLTTAVLHEKDTTTFRADYAGATLSEWKWLVYQWAVTEDVVSFLQRDGMLDAGADTARTHLVEKYGLEIDEKLFERVLQMKRNYLDTSQAEESTPDASP